MNHFQTERNFEEGKMKDDMMNEIQQKNEKSFPAHSKIFEELFTLSHVDRILIDFLIKVYFLLHQSETIAADDKNI